MSRPRTPLGTPQPQPPPPQATSEQVAAHDKQAAELARHKPGRHAADDAEGSPRVTCPAVAGKVRCPLRPASMTLSRDRPEILTPPEHPPAAAPSRPSPS